MVGRLAGSGTRSPAPRRDWTKGSISGNILSLGWPIVVSGSLVLMGPVVDMIWVGRLGSASVAGVGVAGLMVSVANPLITGLNTGVTALVARFAGAGDDSSANSVISQAFIVNAALALTLALIGIFFAGPILRTFGVAADVAAEGAAYLRISLVGMLTMSLVGMSNAAMQASGDTITPMRISIIYRLFHVVLAPFLIYGWWLFPRLEVSGAALTGVLSQALGGGLGMWFLLSGRTRLRLNLKKFRFDPHLIWRIVKIGLPASIHTSQRSLVNLVMMRIIVPFGTLAVAAHAVSERVESLALLPGTGLGQATGVLVGQNLGARQQGRAARSGWLGAGMVEAVTAVFAVAAVLWPKQLVGIFNSEPGVVEIGSTFLRIMAVNFLFVGGAVTLMQAINGAGDTMVPMAVGLVITWAVRMPLAFLLPQIAGLGVYGVRWAIVSGTFAAAAIYTTYFWMGRWKHKKI